MDKRGADIFLYHTCGKEFSKPQIARFLGRTRRGGIEPDYGFDKAWKALDLIESGALSTLADFRCNLCRPLDAQLRVNFSDRRMTVA